METKKRRKKPCCVPGCQLSNRHLAQKEEKFFCFSRVPAKAQEWVRAINHPDLVVEEAHTYHRNKYVCHRHFATSQYNTPERLHLNRNAVPTLFLPSSDSTENGPSATHLQEVFLSSLRCSSTNKIAESGIQDERESGEDGVKEATGKHEEAGSQFLQDPYSGLYMDEHNNVSNLQPLQKDQDRLEVPVQEDTQLRQDILTENDRAQHHNSNGTQTNHQNHCREPVTLDDTAVNERDITETCDATSDNGDADECRDVKFIPNEPCTVAVDEWENLPNQLCRLCASTDEHPKQSIFGWMSMLKEIIPDLVALDDGLPQHICRPCVNKLYTCTKIKGDFVEAYNKLQESCGFARSPGIQFTDIPLAMSDYPEEQLVSGTEEQIVSDTEEQIVSETEEQIVSETEEQIVSETEEQIVSDTEEQIVSDTEEQIVSETEEQIVSETEEQIVSETEEQIVPDAEEQIVFEVPSEGLCGVTPSSNKDVLEGKKMILNTGGDLSLNLEKYAISATHDEATPQGKTQSVDATSGECNIKERKVGKYKYVCGECEEMFTTKGALKAHRLTHPKVFECEYCRKICRSAAHLDDHRRIHTKELPFMCEICGKCFRTTVHLQSHKYVHKPRIYACEICDKKCSCRSILRQHKKVHFTDSQLICEVCGKILYTPFTLQIHLRTHTGEKPFQCDVCGKCFISAEKLKRHRVIHADRKFQCITCGKVFRFKESLVEHEECHSKLEYYRCVICFRAYSSLRNMRRHRRLYCKQPICIVCNETFLTGEMVKEHRSKEHTQEEITLAAKICNLQRYCKCPFCAQGVTGINNMVKHMKECHSGYNYEPFGCGQCSETFSTVSALHIHARCHSETRLIA